ncbi:hypothetical protein, partial [Streptomyces sp. Root66D1]|uniref:hypothetical protein n=1 Tax=Streptomyces sp. Root66D1 TaxID=1736582 RepID=UPI001F5BB56F
MVSLKSSRIWVCSAGVRSWMSPAGRSGWSQTSARAVRKWPVRDVAGGAVGVVADVGEGGEEVAGQPLDRRRVEQLGGEGRLAREGAVRLLGQEDGDVELRGPPRGLQQLDRRPRQAPVLHRQVLQGEHRLDQRVAAEVAVGGEVFDEAFEGEVLVGVGVEGGLADFVEEGGEGGVGG